MNEISLAKDACTETNIPGVFMASIRNPELYEQFQWANAVSESIETAYLFMLEYFSYGITDIEKIIEKMMDPQGKIEVQPGLEKLISYFPDFEYQINEEGLIIPGKELAEMYAMYRVTLNNCGMGTNTALAFFQMHSEYSQEFELFKLRTEEDSRFTYDKELNVVTGRTHAVALLHHKKTDTWIAFSPANIFNYDTREGKIFPRIDLSTGEEVEFQRLSNIIFGSNRDAVVEVILSMESLGYNEDSEDVREKWNVRKFNNPSPDYYFLFPNEGEEITNDNLRVLIVRTFIGKRLEDANKLNPEFTPRRPPES
jgi:hypothetical protein